MVTMLLGGLWHGAGWTFVAWGGLHGALLMLNHGWRRLCPWEMPRALGRLLTVFAVMLAWTACFVLQIILQIISAAIVGASY